MLFKPKLKPNKEQKADYTYVCLTCKNPLVGSSFLPVTHFLFVSNAIYFFN